MKSNFHQLTFAFLFATLLLSNVVHAHVEQHKPDLNSPNYYTRLGLKPGASEKEIKIAYRKLTSLYHPDKVGLNASEQTKRELTHKMQQLNEAYEGLTNKEDLDQQSNPTSRANTEFNSANIVKKIFEYYKDRDIRDLDADPETERDLLITLFSQDRVLMKSLIREIIPLDIWLKISNRPIFGHSPELLFTYFHGWSLLNIDNQITANILSQLQPANPLLTKILIDTDFSTPRGEYKPNNSDPFGDAESLKTLLTQEVVSRMFNTPRYKHSKKDQEALVLITKFMWDAFIGNGKNSNYTNDGANPWCLFLFNTIDDEKLRNNPIMASIYRDLYQLFNQNRIQMKYSFDTGEAEKTYYTLIEKHKDYLDSLLDGKNSILAEQKPSVLSQLYKNDDKSLKEHLIDFYVRLPEDRRNFAAFIEAEKVLVKSYLSLDINTLYAYSSDLRYSEAVDVLSKRSIWGDEANGFARMFFEGYAARITSDKPEIAANILSHLDIHQSRYFYQIVENAHLNNRDSYWVPTEYVSTERDFVRAIIGSLIKTERFQKSDAKIILAALTKKAFCDDTRYNLYLDRTRAAILNLYKSLDDPEYRVLSDMAIFYRKMYSMYSSGEYFGFNDEEKEIFNKYSEKYKEYLASDLPPDQVLHPKVIIDETKSEVTTKIMSCQKLFK